MENENFKIIEEMIQARKEHIKNYKKQDCITSMCLYLIKEVEALENLLSSNRKLKTELEFKQLTNLNNLKQFLKEEIEKRKKENKPYEDFERESRMYWINLGVISFCEVLLRKVEENEK